MISFKLAHIVNLLKTSKAVGIRRVPLRYPCYVTLGTPGYQLEYFVYLSDFIKKNIFYPILVIIISRQIMCDTKKRFFGEPVPLTLVRLHGWWLPPNFFFGIKKKPEGLFLGSKLFNIFLIMYELFTNHK